MVSNHTPRVYATVTAHVSRELSIRMVKGPAAAERGSALIMHNKQQESRSLLPLTQRPPHTEDGEQRYRRREEVRQSEKAHNAPEGNQSVTVPDSGNRRQKDHLFCFFFGCFCFVFVFSKCRFLFVFKLIFVRTLLLLSCRLHVY